VGTVFVTVMYCNSTMKSNLTHEWQHNRELSYTTHIALVLSWTSLRYTLHIQICLFFFFILSIWHLCYWITESKTVVLVDSTTIHSCQHSLLLTLGYVVHNFFDSHFWCPLLGKVGYFENKYLKLSKIIIPGATQGYATIWK